MVTCTSPRDVSHADECARLPHPSMCWANFPNVRNWLRRITQSPRLHGAILRAAKVERDWRFRTLVPVLALNVIAFAVLYNLMEHYAADNMIATHRYNAATLLNDLELNFEAGIGHDIDALGVRMKKQAEIYRLLAFYVYDMNGQPLVGLGSAPTQMQVAQAQAVLARPGHPPMWVTEGEEKVVLHGVRELANGSSCQGCHRSPDDHLGAIQIGMDLTQPMAEVKSRVRKNFAMAGITWVGLLGLMFWTGGVVIGRPLAKLEKSISEAGGAKTAGRHDLEGLASRVNGTIWELIRTQQRKDEDMKRQMVRAEQLAALGELAAGLTHEIKNPLAGLSATIELLRDDDQGQYRDIYEQMLAELKRVSSTLDSLLRLAKPQPPKRVAVDMSKVVRDVEALFVARTRRAGLQLEVDIPDSDVPSLQLDHGLMVQLLVNLLTNSIQATDRGGTISVLLAPFPHRDGVVLAVSDTGRGIPKAALERIFDPFFTTKEEGTGLGLPICRQIVEQHGGTMTIESEEGKGTRVVVLLPDMTTRFQHEEHHGATATA
jgi:signal transduction histidine kinase